LQEAIVNNTTSGHIKSEGPRALGIMKRSRRLVLRAASCATVTIGALLAAPLTSGQPAAKTLVAVWAHADDEAAAGPVLARYARDGVQVYTIIVTDGAQGGAHTSIARGPELARVRADEARCASDVLGIHTPILLGFPDAQLGSYLEDRSRLFEVTARIQEELQRLRPDAVITWGPEGGTGHPDHRLISSIVTQLARAGAPGAPERLFYGSLPVEGIRVVSPARGVPPFMVPQAKYLTTIVPFTSADFDAFHRSMACHKTQYSEEVLKRILAVMKSSEKLEWPLSPAFPIPGAKDLFGD
jgi:LmbE family N-acetylglucosaminyl deacetylase